MISLIIFLNSQLRNLPNSISEEAFTTIVFATIAITQVIADVSNITVRTIISYKSHFVLRFEVIGTKTFTITIAIAIVAIDIKAFVVPIASTAH